jgi:ubiquinone/menaquinone biosynthesis C-methylase UbiE
LRDHRFFAAVYDRMTAASEEAGLNRMRAELLREASGRTLELGAGTGRNLPHYPEAVTELVLTEPDRFMARQLRKALSERAPKATVEVVEAPAESLPLPDASFDTAVSTLCLCTVDDQGRALAELLRVLRPGGRLLFLEHVRNPEGGRAARWQDRLQRPWGWVAAGCHPNRATDQMLSTVHGLSIERLDRERLPKAPAIVRPMIAGSAVRES